jgi:hypothetical protein
VRMLNRAPRLQQANRISGARIEVEARQKIDRTEERSDKRQEPRQVNARSSQVLGGRCVPVFYRVNQDIQRELFFPLQFGVRWKRRRRRREDWIQDENKEDERRRMGVNLVQAWFRSVPCFHRLPLSANHRHVVTKGTSHEVFAGIFESQ